MEMSMFFLMIDFSLLERGGPVMWVLFGLSLLGLLIFIERMLFFHRNQIRSTEFVDGIKNIVRRRRLLEALTVCEETPGPAAGMVKAALLHHEEDAEQLRFAVQEAALAEVPTLERRIGTLAAIAQCAPVLGLLGTVLGIMQIFQRMEAEAGYIAPTLLSGGFWEALLTTAAGLAIAVPAFLGHHFLRGRVRVLVRDMEWVGNEMMQFLHKELPLEKAAETYPVEKPEETEGGSP